MKFINRLPAYIVYALIVYMPFHVFLTQSVSLATGGLNEWKVAKDVVLILALILTLVLVWGQRKGTKLFNRLVLASVLYGLIYLVVWAVNPDIYRQTALLGTLYNTRVVGYALLGVGANILAPQLLSEKRLIKVVVSVAAMVAFLGLIQYFLPKDTLTHFGYSVTRGVKPAFFIDDKVNLPRIMSTLRDPNSLGAYLVLPICLAVGLFMKTQKRRLLFGGLIILQLLALFLTFSRGGLVAAIIAIGVLIVLQFRQWLRAHLMLIAKISIVLVVVFGVVGYTQRNRYVTQNVILHSDKSTVALQDSNDLHVSFARKGAIATAERPFGHGPGTAGIVSIQNQHGGVLTENYYVQLGYEVGVLGLAVFLAIWAYVVLELNKRRSMLTYSLLASAAAYAFLCLIMHLWSNEAVAAQWWLLSGVIISSRLPNVARVKATK